MITGAIINALAILVGGAIGLVARGRISERFSKSIIRTLGLCVGVIGLQSAIAGDIMLMVVSLALGTLCGEALDIEAALNRLGRYIQARFTKDNSTFAEGFVTTTLVYCVGAMAIVASIESGINGELSLITTKSIIDGVSAIFFAASLGLGVLFSALAVFIYQGTIELFASNLQHVLSAELVAQFSAVGGVMIVALALNLSINANFKVANMLPSFVFAIAYYTIF